MERNVFLNNERWTCQVFAIYSYIRMSTIFLRLVPPHFSSPLSKSLYSFSFQLPVFVCRLMNAKLPCKTKALSPPLCPAFVIYLSVAHCSSKEKEIERESDSKRANKVKVNPLVYCFYSSACNYYWKINIFFIPVERNYCYKIKKTALPLALNIYIYIYASLSFQFLSSLILSPLLLSSFAGKSSWESSSEIFSALLTSFVLRFSVLCINRHICFSNLNWNRFLFFFFSRENMIRCFILFFVLLFLSYIFTIPLRFRTILHNNKIDGKLTFNFSFIETIINN